MPPPTFALGRRQLVAASVATVIGCSEDSETTSSPGSTAGAGGSGSGASGSGASGSGATGGTGGRPTPGCALTEDNPLGPAYVPDAPYRNELNVLDWPGVPLTISGTVRNTDCQPIAAALLDIWQASEAGNYDGSPLDPDGNPAPDPAFPLRGRLETAADGTYSFSTIYPGFYTGRTRHIHITISAAGHTALTTQLYFEGVPQNASDGLIEPELVIPLTEAQDGSLSGVFDIVLAIA